MKYYNDYELIYLINENDEIAVVYRRNDGKYGLIETER